MGNVQMCNGHKMLTFLPLATPTCHACAMAHFPALGHACCVCTMVYLPALGHTHLLCLHHGASSCWLSPPAVPVPWCIFLPLAPTCHACPTFLPMAVPACTCLAFLPVPTHLHAPASPLHSYQCTSPAPVLRGAHNCGPSQVQELWTAQRETARTAGLPPPVWTVAYDPQVAGTGVYGYRYKWKCRGRQMHSQPLTFTTAWH